MPPVIAISPSGKPHDYEESIRRAFGDPRTLDRAVDRPEDVVRACDGILLCGGGDVDPALYGEAPHATYAPAEPGRDAYELELVRLAIQADVPLLAICRGVQVLNVAMGGTIVQDIPSEVNGAGPHSVKDTSSHIAHEVWIASDTLIFRLMQEKLEDGETLQVNSRHHQAVKKIADGFVVSATAPDGVIETIERPASRFCLGVQWHPENFYRTGEFRPLFEGFVRACEKK